MAITIETAKDQFRTDTAMEWNANIHAFIQYYQAKLLEEMRDQQQTLMTQLIQKVDELNTGV